MYSNVQVMLKVKQGVYVTHISGPLCTLLSMLTGPQQPSVPQLTLTPDWHLWSYITSLNSPVTTSSAELSTEKKPLYPNKKPKHHICQQHLFVLNSAFYPFTSILSMTRAALMIYSAEEKSQLPGNCLCRLWLLLKESYGWQQEERRGERMWEGQ